jgi:hypothetical protein
LIYATSQKTGSVEVYDAAGNLVESIREVDGQALQQPIGIATAIDGAILITDSGRSAVYRYLPPTLPVEVIDDGAVTTEGSPAASTGDGSGGASSDIVLPGGATPAADGGAGGAEGGSFQLTPAAPTNQAPPAPPGGG